jgi:hypothetical protein
MKIELESLVQKFESCRTRAGKKRAIYPIKLRTSAAALLEEYSAKTLANELGVSVASIKSWSKTFAPRVSEKDMVTVEIATKPEPISHKEQDIKVKIAVMELSVPSGKLASTLTDIMRGMGATSC